MIKVTVNLPIEQIDFLQGIAAKHSITFTDALRRAIRNERFFVEERAKGSKILVQDGNSIMKEVIQEY